MHKLTQQFLLKTVKFLCFWVIFAGLFYLIAQHIKLFIPVIGGLILFGILNPMVKLLEKSTFLSRKVSLGIGMVLMVLSLGGIITWFTLLIVKEVQDLMLKWPFYVESIKQSFSKVWPHVEGFYSGMDPQLVKTLTQSLDKLGTSTYDFVSKTLLSVSSWVFFLPELFIIMVITLVSAYFITQNWQIYKEQLLNIFPAEWRNGLRGIGKDVSVALVGFLRAQMILVGLTIVLCIAGLYFIGARYAFLTGLISGLFGILPVLGAGLVLVPWALFEAVTGNVGFAIELVILVGVLSVVRHVIEPKVLGDNVGLDPLIVLLSMYIGLESIGPVGLIAGPFVVIFYKSLQKAGVFKNL